MVKVKEEDIPVQQRDIKCLQTKLRSLITSIILSQMYSMKKKKKPELIKEKHIKQVNKDHEGNSTTC